MHGEADQESLSMDGDSEEEDDNEIDFDFVEAIAEYASKWVLTGTTFSLSQSSFATCC